MRPRTTSLIIDDDVILSETMKSYLARQGYDVLLARSGLEGLRQFYQSRPHIVLLDVMLPDMDGFEVCERIRQLSTTPVIMLSARGQEMDRVQGLRKGADDYMVKPFGFQELQARMQAILRRSFMGAEEPYGQIVEVGELEIDAGKGEVRRGGNRLAMTMTELRLLLYLADNVGHTVSHEQILQEVWGPEYVNDRAYIKVFIRRLREKLEPDPSQPRYILTERGIGYRLVSMAAPRREVVAPTHRLQEVGV
ncbi:MAG: response regulator transcription factor [Chloroflexi bacterium]|jgi:two-component system KDP operon response regulator KdpE|nr:response regulator transcription factor [Chloroflexota bacterium]